MDEPPVIQTWQQAELFAMAHMTGLGFDDATVTGAGADGGIDVVCEHAVAQVKHHTSPIGSPAVQQLAGIASARGVHGIVYSYSGFSAAGVAAGEASELALFSYTTDGVVASWTSYARELQEEGFVFVGSHPSLAFDQFAADLNSYAQRVADQVPAVREQVVKAVARWSDDHSAIGAVNTNRFEKLFREHVRLCEQLNGSSRGSLASQLGRVLSLDRINHRLVNEAGGTLP